MVLVGISRYGGDIALSDSNTDSCWLNLHACLIARIPLVCFASLGINCSIPATLTCETPAFAGVAGAAFWTVWLCHHSGGRRVQTVSQFQPAGPAETHAHTLKPQTLAEAAQLRCGDGYSRRPGISSLFSVSSRRFQLVFSALSTMPPFLWLFVPRSLLLIWYAAALNI